MTVCLIHSTISSVTFKTMNLKRFYSFKTIQHVCYYVAMFGCAAILIFYLMLSSCSSHTIHQSSTCNKYQAMSRFSMRNRCTDSKGQHIEEFGPSNSIENTKSTRKRLWVTVRGRLGNQIFNFISAYGIARLNNRELFLSPDLAHKLWNVFDTSALQFGVCSIPSHVPKKRLKIATYQPQEEILPQYDDIELKSWIQTYKYFQKYASDVRRILKFHDFLSVEAQFIC